MPYNCPDKDLIALPERGLLDEFLDWLLATGPARKLSDTLLRLLARGCTWTSTLDQGRIATLDGPASCRVRCVRGRVLVTAPGLGSDYVLAQGQALCIRKPGLAAITGLDDGSRVEVTG